MRNSSFMRIKFTESMLNTLKEKYANTPTHLLAKVEIDFLKATGAVGTNSALFQSVVNENKQIG